MAVPTVTIEAQVDQVYCPFTGKPVHGDDGVSPMDSLLFVYYGDAAEYAYVSEALVLLLEQAGTEASTDEIGLEPGEVAGKLDLKSCFVLNVDGGWNGVNSYCFRLP